MQTQQSSSSVLGGEGVDVGSIEKQLAEMWGNGEGPDGEHGIVRACTQNLIIYTTSLDSHSRINEIVEATAKSHPGRTLILVADRAAAESSLKVHLSTHCNPTSGSGRQICGEQVTLNASGTYLETAASAISPLLMSDVPVFLLWDDAPYYDDHLFNQMITMADRMVIDSAAFQSGFKEFPLLDKLIKRQGHSIHVSDLNWGRLTSWRTLVASFWDVPDYRRYLDNLRRVDIEYASPGNDKENVSPKALLICGWLASRLGWKLRTATKRDGKTIACTVNSNSHEIEVSIHAASTETNQDGRLTSILLSDGEEASFEVGLSIDHIKFETSAGVRNQSQIRRVVDYPERSEGEGLCRELSILGPDTVYEGTVHTVCELVTLLTA